MHCTDVMSILQFPILLLVLIVSVYVAYCFLVATRFSPLHNLPGPPVSGLLGTHLGLLLDAGVSPRETEKMVNQYGRTFRIIGMGIQDERLMTLDSRAVSHILSHTTIYEKPWQSRRLITGLIGEGLLGSEGHVHRRQRKISNPAFSSQNLRAFMPLFFQKAEELRDRWFSLMTDRTKGAKIDVCHWLGRTTFDIIGLAGFDYSFHAIQDESNEVYLAYRDMFEIVISQGQDLKTVAGIYFPFIHRLWPDEKTRAIAKSQEVIYRVGRQLVQEKKHFMDDVDKECSSDLLSLLLKSNLSTDIPPDQRISDDDILNQISTFLFAGSDTSSLTMTWTLHLLSQHQDVQTRLREEVRGLRSKLAESWITVDDTLNADPTGPHNRVDIFARIDSLPLLDCVLRESLRLIPVLHSSLRVATRDDEIPLSEPVIMKDGTKRTTVRIKKGQFALVAVEGLNLDRGVWGETGWEFDPDRWLDLPEKAKQQPGFYSNILTFSAGPRSCIGMRFAIIEMKIILYTLVSSFMFSEAEKIRKLNVVLMRPYVHGRRKERSQCPMNVTPC